MTRIAGHRPVRNCPEPPNGESAHRHVLRLRAIAGKREPPPAVPDLSKLALIDKADARGVQLVRGEPLVIAFVQGTASPATSRTPRRRQQGRHPRSAFVHRSSGSRSRERSTRYRWPSDLPGERPGRPDGSQQVAHPVHTGVVREQALADLRERNDVSTHRAIRQLRPVIHTASMSLAGPRVGSVVVLIRRRSPPFTAGRRTLITEVRYTDRLT